uniref:Uncharacterized protein n=1 Tax=uncultured bacterium contig00085 TaxID=1181558 RepID=A0A806KCS0_9BACT|nr:hypothetical protein [uncultured bacterium contig00085]
MHTDKTEEENEKKRTESMFAAFLLLVKTGDIDASRFTLNRSLLKSTIKHYLQDLRVLKARYGIEELAQPQKAAGLTAAAIMKFRPILPKNGSDENLFESEVNEIFAILHGLCLCSEKEDGKVDLQAIKTLSSKTEFYEWLSNFRYLLKFRNYTAESLVMVFDTLVHFAK